MSKKRKKKNRAKKERQNKRLIDKVKSERHVDSQVPPDYDKIDACDACNKRIHVWNTGYATQAQACCFEKLHEMLKERDVRSS